MDTGKVNSKGKKVLISPKGATYVIEGGKKKYVKITAPRKPIVAVAGAKLSPKLPANPWKKLPSAKALSPKLSPKLPSNPWKKLPTANLTKTSGSLQVSCSTTGLSQISSTCWFNSALNGVVLASKTARMLIEKIDKMSKAERAALENLQIDELCPKEMGKKYVLAYAYRILSNRKQRADKNESLDLVGKMFTPGRLPTPVATGRAGYYPVDAIKQILSRVFPEKRLEEIRTRDPETGIKVSKGVTFVLLPAYKEKTPADWPLSFTTSLNRTFELSHCTYMTDLTDGGQHGVVAYACGKKRFVFDSNTKKPLEINWHDRSSTIDLLDYSDSRKFFEGGWSSYALYVLK